MKKFTIILALVLMVSLLAGCAGTTVVYTDCTCPVGGHTVAPQPVPQGAVKTGLAIVPVVKATDAGEADGKVEFDVTLVAVTVDNNGVITDCVIDSLGTTVAFTNAGAINPETNKAPATKNELGEAYGMKADAGSKYEWNEQAANFAAYVTGKTPAEVSGIAVNEATYPTDADLTSGVTIAIGGFQALIAKAAA